MTATGPCRVIPGWTGVLLVVSCVVAAQGPRPAPAGFSSQSKPVLVVHEFRVAEGVSLSAFYRMPDSQSAAPTLGFPIVRQLRTALGKYFYVRGDGLWAEEGTADLAPSDAPVYTLEGEFTGWNGGHRESCDLQYQVTDASGTTVLERRDTVDGSDTNGSHFGYAIGQTIAERIKAAGLRNADVACRSTNDAQARKDVSEPEQPPAAVRTLGVGTPVLVRLTDKSNIAGRITSVGPTSFTLRVADTTRSETSRARTSVTTPHALTPDEIAGIVDDPYAPGADCLIAAGSESCALSISTPRMRVADAAHSVRMQFRPFEATDLTPDLLLPELHVYARGLRQPKFSYFHELVTSAKNPTVTLNVERIVIGPRGGGRSVTHPTRTLPQPSDTGDARGLFVAFPLDLLSPTNEVRVLYSNGKERRAELPQDAPPAVVRTVAYDRVAHVSRVDSEHSYFGSSLLNGLLVIIGTAVR